MKIKSKPFLKKLSPLLLAVLLIAQIIMVVPAVDVADIIPNPGFENDLTSWTTYDSVSAVGEQTIAADSNTWKIVPNGAKMAMLIPSGSSGAFEGMANTLCLSTESRSYITGQFPAITNAAYIYTDISLNAGDEFSIAWNYVATDYEPFNDASFVSLVNLTDSTKIPVVNGYTSEVGILGATVSGTGNYSTGSYGSTGWQTAEFRATSTGNYRLGFTVYNLDDTALSPVLFVDDAIGFTYKNGTEFGPIPQDNNAPPPPEVTSLNYNTVEFLEADSNDGSIETTATITLIGDTFTGTVNEAMSGVQFSNVPTGLTPVLMKTGDTTATLSFSGTAELHGSINNVDNVTLIFGNAAFSGGNASVISGASTNYLAISYSDPVAPSTYTVTVDSSIQNGSVTVNNSESEENETITITVSPNTGYQLKPDSLKVSYGESNECELTAGLENTYTFVMPPSNVAVAAILEKIPAQAPIISIQPSAETVVTYGSIDASISLTATVDDGGTLSYQWYKGENSTDTTPADNKKAGTESVLPLPTDLVAGTHYFFCITTNTLSNLETQSTISNIATAIVNKAIPTVTTPTPGTVTYSPDQQLSDISLPDGWSWVDALTSPLLGSNGYEATYTPSDTENYDYTEIDGWDNSSNTVTRTVILTLQPLTATALDNVSATIKAGSINGTALLKALVTDQFDAAVDTETTNAAEWSEFPADYNTATSSPQTITVRVHFKYGYTPEYQDVVITYDIVNPDALKYTTVTIPEIDATNSNNVSSADLLAYINTYKALTASWPTGSIGTSTVFDTAPDFSSLPEAYIKTGTNYQLSQTYLGYLIAQSLTVNEVKQTTPILTIDYSSETLNTTASMAYSVEGGDWQPCTANISISSWLGSTVSFKTAAEGFKIDSDITVLNLPIRDAAPVSLQGTINDNKTKITINGLDDAIDYEYSLNGTQYFDLAPTGIIEVPDYQNHVHIRKKHVSDTSLHSESAAVDVKYILNFVSGSDSSIAPCYAIAGEAIESPATPTRLGFSFSGWYTGEDGSGVHVSFPHTMTANLTVYGKWDSPGNYPLQIDTTFLVNGENQNTGATTTEVAVGKTVSTITIDGNKLDDILNTQGINTTITIPSPPGSDVTTGILNGQTVKNMETKEAILELKTETVTYRLPATQINIDDVSDKIGEQVQLKDIKVNVTIAAPAEDTVHIMEDTANENNYMLVVEPVEFEITCTSGDKTIEVSKFNGYVERTVAIPDEIDPSRITTGIVLNNDGTFSHVPTSVITIDGKYYAKINSLTNSTYSVIWNPVEFSDMENHWAKDAVNDMGSRLVVTGVGNNSFDPNKDITRAEFATIIIRSLGLTPETGESSFSDVASAAWYSGYIKTASSYGIIMGYGDGTFGPNDRITREQAMTMISRAMGITNLHSSLTENEITNILKAYTDLSNASEYAKENIAACIDTGIVSGRSQNTIAPKDNITRAEVAVIIQRLLQKSGLI
jgi:uncharacterized repeat protein (TIGR02543 family)